MVLVAKLLLSCQFLFAANGLLAALVTARGSQVD